MDNGEGLGSHERGWKTHEETKRTQSISKAGGCQHVLMGSVVVCECGYNKLIFRVRPTVSHRTRTQAQRCAQGLEGSHPTSPNAPQASKQASKQEEQMEHSRLTGDMPLRAYTLVTPPLLKQTLALASRGVMLVLHPPKTCLTSRLTTPDRHLPQALKKQDRVAPRALKTPSYASKQEQQGWAIGPGQTPLYAREKER